MLHDELELTLDDDGKLFQRWINKKVNAEKEGLKCLLSYHEYCLLVKEANLVSYNLGFTGDKYVLARYNDDGDYTYGNCRFITQLENSKEKKVLHKEKKILHKENKTLHKEKKVLCGVKRCKVCGSPLKWRSSDRCKTCYLVDKSKNIPDKDTLYGLIMTHTFCAIGDMFHVSDNAVRRWCKKYNLPYKYKDIKELRLKHSTSN